MLKLTQTWFLFLNYLESTYYFIHCWVKTFVDQSLKIPYRWIIRLLVS